MLLELTVWGHRHTSGEVAEDIYERAVNDREALIAELKDRARVDDDE